PIPAELGRLTKLKNIFLGENELTGQIPTSFLNCTAVVGLYLYQNQLSGHIPWELCSRLSYLRFLYLWGNELSGKIPNSIGNCSKLEELVLNDNWLSGTVPMELGKLVLLKMIHLSHNKLVSGSQISLSFLTALTNCSDLEVIKMSHNHLSGVFPQSIGQLSSNLSILLLAYNKISGSMPQDITNLTNLAYMDLSHNLLRGYIPYGIKRLHKLERLDLSGNRLEGSIPNEIGQLQSLGLLNVSHNNLSGSIPDSLGRLQQLRRIFLHHNHFSGEIPAGLRRCPNLELLDFSHNELRGNIPGDVMASLQNIQFYVNLSWNFLHGPLPGEISKIISAQAIDISGNELEGAIPGVVAGCLALEHLNLSHNAFTGLIPDAISKLQNLESVDLSSNFLSGTIPMSLKQLKALHYINLAFNNLTGVIPEQGLFPNKTLTALLVGNPGLCGPKKYLLPACQKQGSGKHTLLTKVIPSAAGVFAFVLCSLILGIMWRRKVLRQHFDLTNIMARRLGYPMFTYEDLSIATNGFDESNLLGMGSSGSVYKGVLSDDKVVAIKVLNSPNEEGQNSFKAECKVLRRIRHRNLVRVISACSYLDFKGLVLQFASNGNLEKYLYPDGIEEDICRLGLSECLNIAIDVAHGMEYLHHDCPVQVVHCDLKPSNVLLDANMTALVTDFGISRLTSSTNSMDSLSTTFSLRGSIGYIAPEYGFGGRVSIEGDVYSYGVLLLEMVTRKKPTDAMFVGDLNMRNW
ncbi:hypothetical protein KI387_019731, partial [Taxus chinensis]